jgi:hypothetical protein
MILCIGTVSLVYTCHQPFQHRLNQSLGVFSYNYEKADIASARRLDLWETSLKYFMRTGLMELVLEAFVIPTQTTRIKITFG